MCVPNKDSSFLDLQTRGSCPSQESPPQVRAQTPGCRGAVGDARLLALRQWCLASRLGQQLW